LAITLTQQLAKIVADSMVNSADATGEQ
jgi:hypothetical protein